MKRLSSMIDRKKMDATLRHFSLSSFRQSYNIDIHESVDMLVAKDGFLVKGLWGNHPRLEEFAIPTIDAKQVHTKPTFRMSFRTQRCIIILDSYYTWKGTTRKPIRVFSPDDALLVPAVYFKTHLGTYGFTIITKQPRESLAEHSDIEPLLFSRKQATTWLDFLPVSQVIKTLNSMEKITLDSHPVTQKIYVKGFDHRSLHCQEQDQVMLF